MIYELLVVVGLYSACAMPEMWVKGCQPQINDLVMTTSVKDDKTTNLCNLTLSNVGSNVALSAIDTTQNYTISFRPNFGVLVEIHCLLSVTAGKIDLGAGYAYKDNCVAMGISAVLWRGNADPNGLTDIPFRYTPTAGQSGIQFTVTCSEGIGNPVYQHMLLIGNYTATYDDNSTSIAVAVVVLLMIILPISGIAIYCLWVKCKDRILNKDMPSIGQDDDDEEEDKPAIKKKKEYENIKESTP